jgi:hypothetical protein
LTLKVIFDKFPETMRIYLEIMKKISRNEKRESICREHDNGLKRKWKVPLDHFHAEEL